MNAEFEGLDYEDDEEENPLFDDWQEYGDPVNYSYASYLEDKIQVLQEERDAALRKVALLKAMLEGK